MKVSCDVILDLIPLVKDGVASDDSVKIVQDHIQSCACCKTEFEIFESITTEEPSIKDEKIIFAIKRSIFLTQLIILIVGSVIGVALTNSISMFYNIVIMPIIGAISFIAFNRKWYLVAVTIFGLACIWQAIMSIVSDGFDWMSLYGAATYSLIYTVLVALGVFIAMLVKFAFKKGEHDETEK